MLQEKCVNGKEYIGKSAQRRRTVCTEIDNSGKCT